MSESVAIREMILSVLNQYGPCLVRFIHYKIVKKYKGVSEKQINIHIKKLALHGLVSITEITDLDTQNYPLKAHTVIVVERR